MTDRQAGDFAEIRSAAARWIFWKSCSVRRLLGFASAMRRRLWESILQPRPV